MFISALTGPIVSVTTSIRTNGVLAYLKDDLAYATGAVGAAIGQILLMVITIFLVTRPIPEDMEIAMGDFTNMVFLSVAVTGIVAGIVMYTLRNISDPVRPDA